MKPTPPIAYFMHRHNRLFTSIAYTVEDANRMRFSDKWIEITAEEYACFSAIPIPRRVRML